MKKNHKLHLSMVLSGGVLLIIILATLLATLSPYDPIAVETGQKFLPPSAQHLLGTDNFGRDTFTRLLYGGRVSLLLTDTFQGLLAYPVFVIITGYVLLNISWGAEIAPTMMDRVPGESFLNPYDVSRLRDFNIFSLVVWLFSTLLNRASWYGNDTSGSAKTPHEQKMAGILGSWRGGFSTVMLITLAIMVITIMNHRNYAPQAKVIRDALSAQAAAETIESDAERRQVIDAITAMPEQQHIIGEDQPLSRKANLDTNVFRKVRDVVGQDGDGNFKLQRFRTLYQQMMLPVVLRETLPTGLLGLLSLLMIMLVLSTDDSRIFNASATILQLSLIHI